MLLVRGSGGGGRWSGGVDRVMKIACPQLHVRGWIS